jgi:hypothetical protein
MEMRSHETLHFTTVHKLVLDDCPEWKYFCETLQAELDMMKPLHSAWCLAMRQLSIPVTMLTAVICI